MKDEDRPGNCNPGRTQCRIWRTSGPRCRDFSVLHQAALASAGGFAAASAGGDDGTFSCSDGAT
jgi:hypothetical protein